MRILDGLLIGIGIVIGWVADKQDFWLLAFYITFLPLIALAILTAERVGKNKAGKDE